MVPQDGRHHGGQPSPLPKYTGPTIDASTLVGSSGFLNDQAFFDMSHLMNQGSTVVNVALGVSGAYTDAQKAAITGADAGGQIQGKDNGYGTCWNLDFSAHPPTSQVLAVETAVRTYLAELQAAKHPNPPQPGNLSFPASRRQHKGSQR